MRLEFPAGTAPAVVVDRVVGRFRCRACADPAEWFALEPVADGEHTCVGCRRPIAFGLPQPPRMAVTARGGGEAIA